MSRTIYLGLDAHKQSVTIAALPETGEILEVRRLPHEPRRLERYFAELAQDGSLLRACYESSGVGFELQRRITSWGHHCDVVASALIPTVGGHRRKFDKHDARGLARSYRAGELTPIRIPTRAEEQDRELVRCRLTVQRDVVRARHYLLKLCTRHGLRYPGKSHWTQQHGAWLRAQRASLVGGAQRALDEYLAYLEYVVLRRGALDREIEALAATPRYQAGVARLRAFRGIDLTAAMVLLTELGAAGVDWARFRSAPALMSFVGLVPTEASSGDQTRRGRISKAGNGRCRHVLVQGAWSARHRVATSATLRTRRQAAPAAVAVHALKAQQRLHTLYHRVAARKGPQIAVVAVARELVGFLWAAMIEPAVAPS